MTKPYYVTPYEPARWQTGQSDLVIDPSEYREQLEARWVGVKFHEPSEHCLLEWEFQVEKEEVTIYGYLLNNNQLISLDPPHSGFFLWHRSVIASAYDLFLSTENSYKNLKLTAKTSEAEIEQFIQSG